MEVPDPPAPDVAVGRWTEEEHALFVQLLRQEGRNWKAIADAIPSRTVIQIRTHAQKFFQKLEKSRDVEPDLMQFLDTSRMHRVSGSTRSDAAVKRRAGEAGTVLALELQPIPSSRASSGVNGNGWGASPDGQTVDDFVWEDIFSVVLGDVSEPSPPPGQVGPSPVSKAVAPPPPLSPATSKQAQATSVIASQLLTALPTVVTSPIVTHRKLVSPRLPGDGSPRAKRPVKKSKGVVDVFGLPVTVGDGSATPSTALAASMTGWKLTSADEPETDSPEASPIPRPAHMQHSPVVPALPSVSNSTAQVVLMPAPAVARTTVPPLGLQLSFAQYRHDIISTAPVVAPAPTVSLPSPHTDDVFAEDGDLLNAPTDVLVTDYEDQALLMALFTDPE